MSKANTIESAITIVDVNDNTKKASFNVSNITTNTTITLTLPSSTDTLVSRASIDTLTNKTLTNPVLNNPILKDGNSNTITIPSGSDTLVNLTSTQTLSNKTLTAPKISSIVNTGTLTLPTSTDTLVGKATTDTLTNKTLTASILNNPSISDYIQLQDVTAPSNGSTGTGRLYKKTGNSNLFWKPDASGAEVQLSNSSSNSNKSQNYISIGSNNSATTNGWVTVQKIIFPGTNTATPSAIYGLVYNSNSNINSSFRIQDITNVTTITSASYTGNIYNNSTSGVIVQSGTISNLSSGLAQWEFQIQVASGNGTTYGLGVLIVY